jgi:hypothetical protein
VVVPCEETYAEVLEQEAPHWTELRQVAVVSLLRTIVALVHLLHRWMVRSTLTASSAHVADLSPEVVVILVQVLAENSGFRLDVLREACHRKGQSYKSPKFATWANSNLTQLLHQSYGSTTVASWAQNVDPYRVLYTAAVPTHCRSDRKRLSSVKTTLLAPPSTLWHPVLFDDGLGRKMTKDGFVVREAKVRSVRVMEESRLFVFWFLALVCFGIQLLSVAAKCTWFIFHAT